MKARTARRRARLRYTRHLMKHHATDRSIVLPWCLIRHYPEWWPPSGRHAPQRLTPQGETDDV